MPVDIFIVSYMKNADGQFQVILYNQISHHDYLNHYFVSFLLSFKEWAQDPNVRINTENIVAYCYYGELKFVV